MQTAVRATGALAGDAAFGLALLVESNTEAVAGRLKLLHQLLPIPARLHHVLFFFVFVFSSSRIAVVTSHGACSAVVPWQKQLPPRN